MRPVTTAACCATLAFLVVACSDRSTPTAAPDRPNFIINGTPTGDVG